MAPVSLLNPRLSGRGFLQIVLMLGDSQSSVLASTPHRGGVAFAKHGWDSRAHGPGEERGRPMETLSAQHVVRESSLSKRIVEFDGSL
jgi:hypothetical protein